MILRCNMKLHGEFVLRQIVDETVAVPVGQTSLEFNGMILLNDVSKVIWQALEQETDLAGLVARITDTFEVSAQEAEADILEFLSQLRQAQLLEE